MASHFHSVFKCPILAVSATTKLCVCLALLSATGIVAGPLDSLAFGGPTSIHLDLGLNHTLILYVTFFGIVTFSTLKCPFSVPF